MATPTQLREALSAAFQRACSEPVPAERRRHFAEVTRCRAALGLKSRTFERFEDWRAAAIAATRERYVAAGLRVPTRLEIA